jgi:hypothetical protein
VADGIYAPVYRVEDPALDARPDRSLSEAELEQLPARDDSVLVFSEQRDRGVELQQLTSYNVANCCS